MVEEALRSRGVLNESFSPYSDIKNDFMNFSFLQETFSKNKSPANGEDFTINKKVLSDDIKMIHEFIEFKFFKKVMKQNNNLFE